MGWFIFDTAEHKFELFGTPRPGLAEYANCLGEMRAIEVEGRDGRRCLSFLTIPPKGAREEIVGKRQNTHADSPSRSGKLKSRSSSSLTVGQTSAIDGATTTS